MTRLLIPTVRFWQRFVSPLGPPRCRFQPTCSAYAIDARQAHGAIKGAWMTLRRLLRCHPLGGSGYDPVPSTRRHDHDRAGAA